MPEIAFITFTNIPGESNFKDHEEEDDVLQFDHCVSKEVDPLDCSKVRSDRHHGQASVLKYMTKGTPLLNKALCEGTVISEIKIKWYRQGSESGNQGASEHYFTHTFKDCIITSIRPSMSNALAGGGSGHMETVTWGYKQLTWTSESGGTEFTDEVRV